MQLRFIRKATSSLSGSAYADFEEESGVSIQEILDRQSTPVNSLGIYNGMLISIQNMNEAKIGTTAPQLVTTAFCPQADSLVTFTEKPAPKGTN